MATYYVRTDGNDSNTGLGSTTALAWRTVQKALGSTGISSGDTVYIAPGVYRENVTIAGTYTAATYIIGDPTASQFSDLAQGLVRLTNYLGSDTTAGSGTIISSGNKNYLNFSFLYFDGSATMLSLGSSVECVIENCAFVGSSLTASVGITGSVTVGVTVNNVIRKCIFSTGSYGINYTCGNNHTSDWRVGISVQNCAFIGCASVTASSAAMQFARGPGGLNVNQGGDITVVNCYIQSSVIGVYFQGISNNTYPTNVRNCLIANCGTAIVGRTATANLQDYNRIIGCTTTLTNVATGANTVTVGPVMLDIGMSQLFGLLAKQTWFSALPASLNIGFGDPTGALTTDLFGSTWFNGAGDPDAGALTSIQLSNTSYYYPTERNASTITIAPGSTSQSIELYLGATGLTASTSGLSARYNRTRTASVSIPLVARVIDGTAPTGGWTAGGFAEVDATNMPGVYRLDIPDAALAAGADDVTIVVRGASGTNGAVMTVKLSSGGLTEAQTAGAVWNAVRSSYATAGSFGEYVNAELVTPVTSAALVRMGPYEVKADGLGASDPLDIQKGAQHGIDIQCVDNNGAGIDITSATVTAKVYNSGATLVDTYSCTATYAAEGRATFTIDTTVTNTPGTYTATITRTTGASDTQVFGPLRIYVRDI